jgi:hypothetical protein
MHRGHLANPKLQTGHLSARTAVATELSRRSEETLAGIVIRTSMYNDGGQKRPTILYFVTQHLTQNLGNRFAILLAIHRETRERRNV